MTMSTSRLPHSVKQRQTTYVQEKDIGSGTNLPSVEDTGNNYGLYSDLTNQDLLPTLKTFYVNRCVN